MRKYVELEADLGSDDEEHDGVIKRINSDDLEEDEEGQDEDLKDFVVQGEDEEIGAADEEMMERFQ